MPYSEIVRANALYPPAGLKWCNHVETIEEGWTTRAITSVLGQS